MSVISQLTLDAALLAKPRSAEWEHELKTALLDLAAENYFSFCHGAGPYTLTLSEEEGRLAFVMRDARAENYKILLSLQPLKRMVQDYFLVCESYYDAIKSHDSRKLEAIDMGRRGLHDEGAERLKSMLSGKISMDHATARRFFTLICVLHMK
jgi:uncharacterized protein (UPF0262 family)